MLRVLSREDWDHIAQRTRDAHSQWLSAALRRASKVPRIPLRRVSDGGWDALMATEEGRAWAAEFWQSTIGDE